MRAAERPRLPTELTEPTGSPWQPLITNVEDREQPFGLERADETIDEQPAWTLSADSLSNRWYAVVDELIDDQAVIVMWAWPETDLRGVPIFDNDDHEFAVTVHALESVINQWRADTGQVIRPIRIGDTFAPINTGIPTEVSQWDAVVDITDAAREQAKTAFYAALGRVAGADALIGSHPTVYDAQLIVPPGQEGISTFSDDAPATAFTEQLRPTGGSEETDPGPGTASPVI